MLDTELPMVIVANSQPENAPSPTVVTASPMMTDFRLLQKWKAYIPMLVTESGMTMEVRLLQLRKA